MDMVRQLSCLLHPWSCGSWNAGVKSHLRIRHTRTKRIQCWHSSEDTDGWHLALLCGYSGSSQFGGKVTKETSGSFTTFSSRDLEIYCVLLLETTAKAFPVLKGGIQSLLLMSDSNLILQHNHPGLEYICAFVFGN